VRALQDTALLGPRSNRDFLLDALQQDMFVRGDEFVRMADHYFPDHLVNTLRQQVNTARAKEGAEPV